MSKQSLIEIDGAVRAESHGIYTVALVNGHEARATLSGRIRSNHVSVVPGDAVKVALSPVDFPTLISKRNAKQSILFRDSWGADYDHPQDWFDNLFTCATAQSGRGNASGYCNPAMDKLVNQADTSQNLSSAISTYEQAQRLRIKDVAGANLEYGTQPYIVQSYVKGAGYTGLFDYRWEGIRILKH